MISLKLRKLSKHFYSDSFVLYLYKYIKSVNYIGYQQKILSICVYLSPIKYAYIKPYKKYIERDIETLMKQRGIVNIPLFIRGEDKDMVQIDYLRFLVEKKEEKTRGNNLFHKENSTPIYLNLLVDKTIHLKKIKDEFTIGRDQSSDMIISHNSISRNHAKIVKNGNKYLIYDLNSRNGTFYKNQKVDNFSIIDRETEVQFGKVKCDFAI